MQGQIYLEKDSNLIKGAATFPNTALHLKTTDVHIYFSRSLRISGLLITIRVQRKGLRNSLNISCTMCLSWSDSASSSWLILFKHCEKSDDL